MKRKTVSKLNVRRSQGTRGRIAQPTMTKFHKQVPKSQDEPFSRTRSFTNPIATPDPVNSSDSGGDVESTHGGTGAVMSTHTVALTPRPSPIREKLNLFFRNSKIIEDIVIGLKTYHIEAIEDLEEFYYSISSKPDFEDRLRRACKGFVDDMHFDQWTDFLQHIFQPNITNTPSDDGPRTWHTNDMGLKKICKKMTEGDIEFGALVRRRFNTLAPSHKGKDGVFPETWYPFYMRKLWSIRALCIEHNRRFPKLDILRPPATGKTAPLQQMYKRMEEIYDKMRRKTNPRRTGRSQKGQNSKFACGQYKAKVSILQLLREINSAEDAMTAYRTFLEENPRLHGTMSTVDGGAISWQSSQPASPASQPSNSQGPWGSEGGRGLENTNPNFDPDFSSFDGDENV